jgi:4-amino-4-deoxy-L-arabinose transferase-like glycosyltransferase
VRLGLDWHVASIALAGLAVRLGLLTRPGLHPDEALYASWALRIADGRDPFLLGVLVDKPPFWPYLMAALLRVAGVDSTHPAELETFVAMARLLSVGAAIVSLVLVWAIAHRAYGRRTALWSMALFAVSPLAVRLAPSLLTDTWLVLWMLVGLWAALQSRSWLTGLACGLAYATKQQAVFVIPLIVAAFLLAPRWSARPGLATPSPKAFGRLAGGFLLIFSIVLWWDSQRWQWMPSFWERSAAAYGGLGLASGDSFLEAAWKWGELVGHAFGWPLLAVLVLGTVGILRKGHGRPAAFDHLLVLFVAVYVGIHLGASMPPWDRYALPLVPLLALLLGRVAASLLDLAAPPGRSDFHLGTPVESGRSRRLRRGFLLVCAAGIVYAAWLAGFSRLPVGDASAYDGVAQIAEHVRQTESPGSILYHHWLGWHYGFYLANAPVELRYWEAPADLAAKAAAEPQAAQWIAFPAGRESPDVLAALSAAGLRLQSEYSVTHVDGSPSITLYRIRRAGVAGSASAGLDARGSRDGAFSYGD